MIFASIHVAAHHATPKLGVALSFVQLLYLSIIRICASVFISIATTI